jgi:hypothetical protein
MRILQLHELPQLLKYGKLLAEKEQAQELSKPLYTQKEMLILLGVSPNTLKKYRENGWLAYSRVQDKYYYSRKDIDEFLRNNHYPAFQYQH